MSWQTFEDICMMLLVGSLVLKWVIQNLLSAFRKESDLTDEEERVIVTAQRLAVAGEYAGVTDLPSAALHDLYDAVRSYEASQK